MELPREHPRATSSRTSCSVTPRRCRATHVSLLDNGIIDSVGVMELVAFLEQDHGLEINDEELVPENLDSVDNLVSFVSRKRAVA